MATQSTNVNFSKGVFRARLDAFFASIGQGFNTYVERRSRVGQIEALNAKSDKELSAMGLRREDIAQHVYRDMFYI